MPRVKTTDALIEKMGKVFAGRSVIGPGEGLSRSELRALERSGLVERVRRAGKRKWADVGPTVVYYWRRINYAPATRPEVSG